MSFWALLLTGVGLSMDAFAVSLCKGLQMPKLSWKNALIIALFFGASQALMPAIGWLLGSQFERYITSVDHWLVFGLLGFVGGKMIYDAFKPGDEEECEGSLVRLDIKQLFVLAFATSIDALAVGISFAFLNVRILPAALTIGVVTFLLSLSGVLVGHRFGTKYRKYATLVGGCALILIGLKVLLEHLGVL